VVLSHLLAGMFLAGLNLPGVDLNSDGWHDKFDRIKFEQPTKFAWSKFE
jgi:hypothetical protein